MIIFKTFVLLYLYSLRKSMEQDEMIIKKYLKEISILYEGQVKLILRFV